MSGLTTPALVVDLDVLEQNLVAAQEMVRGTAKLLRPHFKTHRTPVLALRQLGPISSGVTCATVGEAEAVVAAGARDVLVASEIVSEAKIRRIAALSRVGRVMAAVDALEPALAIAAEARRIGTAMDILVDVDIGLGRCGVTSAAEAVRLAQAVSATRGLRFAGIMGYEGRLRASVADRTARIKRAFAKLAEAKAAIETTGLGVQVVSAAGTSTLREALQDPVITEIQTGTYALMEPDLEGLGLPFRCAVSILSTVISCSPGRVVVDAGRLAIGCDYGPPISLHIGSRTLFVSDEHTVLRWGGEPPPLGAQVRLRPSHNRTTFNSHDVAWLVRGGTVVERAPIAPRSSSQ